MLKFTLSPQGPKGPPPKPPPRPANKGHGRSASLDLKNMVLVKGKEYDVFASYLLNFCFKSIIFYLDF